MPPCLNFSSQADKAKKLVPRLLLSLETAKNATGYGACRSLLHTTHDHAQVAGFHDHSYTLGFENLHNGISNFARQSLLHLKSAAEHLSDSRELRDADDIVAGNISDVHLE